MWSLLHLSTSKKEPIILLDPDTLYSILENNQGTDNSMEILKLFHFYFLAVVPNATRVHVIYRHRMSTFVDDRAPHLLQKPNILHENQPNTCGVHIGHCYNKTTMPTAIVTGATGKQNMRNPQ
jgi:hypothetical protein